MNAAMDGFVAAASSEPCRHGVVRVKRGSWPARASDEATRTAEIVVYGAFNSPWSYLASRRAELLAGDGVRVDWRAVDEGAATGLPGRPGDSVGQFESLRMEMDRVVGALLPGERLPYVLAGFLTDAGAAVTVYGKARQLGAGSTVRGLIFEAFWLHAFDLDDEKAVRTVVADALHSRPDVDEPSDEPSWDRLIGMASPALAHQWATDWRRLGRLSLPVLTVDGAAYRWGAGAVEWLGLELLHRDVEVESIPFSRRRSEDPSAV
jgi:2-hydroxychromene-2-carboxylate isomerase